MWIIFKPINFESRLYSHFTKERMRMKQLPGDLKGEVFCSVFNRNG